MPLIKRGKAAIATQWEEVSKALKRQLSAVEAVKKWKNLKNCFVRYLNEEKKTKVSGAAATKRRKWRWYDQMLFYKDVQMVRSTTSNLGSASSEVDSDSDANRSRKRANLSSDSDFLLEKIATALQEPIAPPVPPPKIMQPTVNKSLDDISHITEVIANAIRRMPEPERLPFAMHLLNVTIDKEVQSRIEQARRN